MIGTKLYKTNADDMAKYTAIAQRCNANNAHIEDKGEYYEVCENVIPEPTVDEKIAQLDVQYNADKAELLMAYQTAQVYGDTDTMESLKADLQAIDEQYDEDYERIVGGE